MKITTKGQKLTVTLDDGRTATVPFDPSSSMISAAGRAVVRVAESLARAKAIEPAKTPAV